MGSSEVFNFYAPDDTDDDRGRSRYDTPRRQEPELRLPLQEVEMETPVDIQRRKDEEIARAIVNKQVLEILERNGGRIPGVGVFRRNPPSAE